MVPREELLSCLKNLLHSSPVVEEFDAAIAVILAWCPDLRVVMVERSRRPDDPWAGDMAFPGGRREAAESPLETALREAEEEACIPRPELELVGYMDPASPRRVRLTVQPVVLAYAGGCPRYVPCRGPEVERVSLVPVPSILELEEVLHPVRGRRVYCYRSWYGDVVWGMSLRVLVRLKALIDRCRGQGLEAYR
jgi:8-oxo-dGTP pyrophosphatase MutT (NUDIX family)